MKQKNNGKKTKNILEEKEQIQKRLNEEINKKKEIQEKLENDINILKNNKNKVSIDIPEEIKTEDIADENVEKLRKKNIAITKNNDINKTNESTCTDNCSIF